MQLSLKEGAVGFTFELPSPMPPPGVPIYEHRLEDGSFALSAEFDDRLSFVLFANGLETRSGHKIRREFRVVDVAISPRLIGSGPFVIRAAWQNRKLINLGINGQTWTRTGKLSTDPETIEPVSLRRVEAGDFRGQNEEAQRKRRERLAVSQPKPKRTHGGKEYAFTSLRHEVAQLSDLLNMAKSGKEHHVLGISSRLRVMVTDRPFGLLQRCAAYLDRPLIRYTGLDPSDPPPIEYTYAVSVSASAIPTIGCYAAVDLDVWLNRNVLYADGNAYTYAKILKDIGDTIGGHRDIDIPPMVATLMKSPGMLSHYNDVTRIILVTAQVVISLANEMLAASDPQP